MLTAAITCAKSSAAAGSHCQQLYLEPTDPADLPAAAVKALADAGWTVKDGEHYCPRHDPADVGESLEVTTRYTPIRDTGWEVRVPPTPFAAPGVTWELEIRRRPGKPDRGPESVSATDAAADALAAHLAARRAHRETFPPEARGHSVAIAHGELFARIEAPFTDGDVQALLDERAAVRAIAPDERVGEDEFYRPGGVYVTANGWFRFTCRAVVAGIALGVEDCLKGRMEPRCTRRNVWRSVRAAGCDHEVDPETGERLTSPADGGDDD